MGPVDPALKMQLRKLTAHLARYIQRAHNLTLAGIVCEYIRDVSEKVYLLSVLRTEWASNAAGSGAGSLGAAMLLSPTTDEVGAEAAAALMVIEDDEDAAGEEDWGELPGTASPRGTGAMAAAAAAPSGAAADVAYYGGGDMAPQDPHAVGSSGGAAAGGVLASGWVRPGTASGGGRPLTGNPSSRPATASSAPLTPTGLASGAGNGGVSRGSR